MVAILIIKQTLEGNFKATPNWLLIVCQDCYPFVCSFNQTWVQSSLLSLETYHWPIHDNINEYFLKFYFDTDRRCGGVFKKYQGFIESPNWPGQYPINVECTWTITPEKGRRILVVIPEMYIATQDKCGDKLVMRKSGKWHTLYILFCIYFSTNCQTL